MRVDRNILAVSVALLLVSLGENLWLKFVPKYLEALGAPVAAIGLYGSVRDFLDGVYQYPGGWIGDRLGRRRALFLFTLIAIAGYIVYLVTPTWHWMILGLALMLAWVSMGSPAVFAVVGDALPKGRRAIGFTMQAIVKRIPLVIAPVVGGLVVTRLGVTNGVRVLLAVTIVFAVAALAAVRRIDLPPIAHDASANVATVWRSFPRSLRTLLAADVFARICEGLVDVFLVIWVTRHAGPTAAQFGILIAVQSLTSMLVYLPAAKFADRGGRKPVVIATFLAFALFPLAVVSATTFPQLVGAFIVGGLREIGEPSRKSMIVDFAEPSFRARSVGLYYLVRSVTIAPSATVGGILWTISPALPFHAAFAVGLVAATIFAIAVRE